MMIEEVKCEKPDTTHETVCRIMEMSRDALGMIDRLGSELFNYDPIKLEDKAPNCMRDALYNVEEIMKAMCDKLRTINQNL